MKNSEAAWFIFLVEKCVW